MRQAVAMIHRPTVAGKAGLALLLALVLVAASGGADAQPRRPPDSDKGSDKPADCTATLGALPKEWLGEAFAIDGITLGGAGLKPQLRLWGVQAGELRDRQRKAHGASFTGGEMDTLEALELLHRARCTADEVPYVQLHDLIGGAGAAIGQCGADFDGAMHRHLGEAQ